MNHSACSANLGAYLDRELGPEDNRRVAAHITRCARCHARLEELKLLSRAIRELPKHPLPETLGAALLRVGGPSTARAPARRLLGSPWLTASLAGAAVLLVVAILTPGRLRPHAPGSVEAKLTAPAGNEAGLPAGPGEKKSAAGVRIAESSLDKRLRSSPADQKTDASDAAESTRDRLSRSESSPAKPPARVSPAPRESAKQPAAPGAARKEGGGEAQAASTPVVSRFTTRFIASRGGKPALARLLPVVPARPDSARAPHESDSGGRVDADRRIGPLAAPSRGSREGQETSILFLARADAGGTIVVAEPIGARLVSVETMATIRSLVLGSRLPVDPAAAPAYFIVEVSLGAGGTSP